MAVPTPSFTLGIEEEYLLIDPRTRDLLRDPDPAIMRDCTDALGERVSDEFLRAQIEVGTSVHATVPSAIAELADMRRTVSSIAHAHDARIIAASTHPFARWWEQMTTPKDRYLDLAEDLQGVAARLVIGGMHVHVAIEDPDLRIDLMNQVSYFLPHLLAMSTSSPFWGGRDTGLRSYRTSVFRTLPRTGLPEEFTSWSEYERHVAVLVEAGIIADASKLWWDVRPSARYPTLEMRASDICTRIDDAGTVAAMYVSILHMLWRLRRSNQRWRRYANMLVSENMWRAQRYGSTGSLMDYGAGSLVPFQDLVAELVELVADDAEELGCLTELRRSADIVRDGTSASRQLATYHDMLSGGASDQEALNAVVDLLVDETVPRPL